MAEEAPNLLARTEELVLRAVGLLQEAAYGLSERQHLEMTVGRSYSVGAIYVPLERLAESGYLSASEPLAVRRGRRKRLYQLTAQGEAALAELRRVQDQLWRAYLGEAVG